MPSTARAAAGTAQAQNSPPGHPRRASVLTEFERGFILTRHWRDTASGIEIEFWLATEHGPRRVRLRPAVAFVPAQQQALAERALAGERDAEWRPLALRDFVSARWPASTAVATAI
jgi:hypothetical protein